MQASAISSFYHPWFRKQAFGSEGWSDQEFIENGGVFIYALKGRTDANNGITLFSAAVKLALSYYLGQVDAVALASYPAAMNYTKLKTEWQQSLYSSLNALQR